MIDPALKENISIVFTGARSFRTFQNSLSEKDSGSWVFFGSDVILEKTISESLPPKYSKISIGENLQHTAKEMRSRMVDYVGLLSTNRKNDCWWLTTLSEKSPSSSHLFLHLCYLKIGMNLSQDAVSHLIIVCESQSMAESLHTNLKKNPTYAIRYYNSWIDSVKKKIQSNVTTLFEKTWFLSRYTGRLVISRLSSLVRNKDPEKRPASQITVIHSWADARSIAGDDSYRDIYFGNLGELLTQKGIVVHYLLDVIPTIWYPVLVYSALKKRLNFLLLEDFISFRDLFASIYHVWDLPAQIKNIPFFDDFDIAPLIREELLNERYTSIGEHAFLCYRACKKIGQNLKVKNFIFTYENQACQKFFALAFRKYSNDTTLTGYVHTYAIPMYTLYSLSENEKDLMPLPDKIIVNGEQSKNVLIECGYPKDRVFTGGALRYTYLKKEMPVKSEKIGSFDVLVAASVNINEAVELIEKSLEAFSGMPEINLIIKIHPTIPISQLSKFFPALPKNATVLEIPVQDLLSRVDLVLYTSSTVAIEAVALGIPVIHVKSDHIIDMNFYEGETAIPSFSDPKDIANAGKHILLNHTKPSRNESERLVKKFFLPVDDTVISIFAASK